MLRPNEGGRLASPGVPFRTISYHSKDRALSEGCECTVYLDQRRDRTASLLVGKTPISPERSKLSAFGCHPGSYKFVARVDHLIGPAHRARSGSPALRQPSINSFEFDCLPRAIHADIVKAESTSSARAAASHASASRPRGVSTVIGSGQTGSAIIATRRQWLSRPCGRLIQMTVCSSGECRDLCPLPSTSSNKTKLPAGTRLSSPSLVWYSADPSSRTVSTRSGTVCQSTYRAPDGMRVKRTFDAAYFADTSNAAASG